MKYFYQQYTRNVTTNLNTHAKKRLTQFFRMRAWQFNSTSDGLLIDDDDIDSAVRWAISRYDSIRADNPNVEQKVYKRQLLLNMAHRIGGPNDHDIKKFTNLHWFQSLWMWLSMQTQIDDFHIWAEINNIEIPKIRNLKIIPICSFNRQNIHIDTDVLYRMMADIERRSGTMVIDTERKWCSRGMFQYQSESFLVGSI